MGIYRWVTVLRRLQKKGWGWDPLSPFLLRPPASERMYLLLIPWIKMASRAQQRRLASPSSLVTTASDVTYRFCRALSDCANFSLIYVTKWQHVGVKNNISFLVCFLETGKGVFQKQAGWVTVLLWNMLCLWPTVTRNLLTADTER